MIFLDEEGTSSINIQNKSITSYDRLFVIMICYDAAMNVHYTVENSNNGKGKRNIMVYIFSHSLHLQFYYLYFKRRYILLMMGLELTGSTISIV